MVYTSEKSKDKIGFLSMKHTKEYNKNEAGNPASHSSSMHQNIAHKLLLSRACYLSFGNIKIIVIISKKSTIFDHITLTKIPKSILY